MSGRCPATRRGYNPGEFGKPPSIKKPPDVTFPRRTLNYAPRACPYNLVISTLDITIIGRIRRDPLASQRPYRA